MAIDERALYESLDLTYPGEETTEREAAGEAEREDNESANEERRGEPENGAESRREGGEAEKNGEEQDRENEEESQEDPGAAEKATQDKEKRARAAESRRQSQQRKAVEEALARERAEEDQRWKDFFATAGLKSPVDGKPITTREEYEAYQRAVEERRIRQNLQKGQLLPEDIEAIVRKAIAQTKDTAKEQSHESEPERAAATGRTVTQEQVDAELAEIRRLDPDMVDLKAILESETGGAFQEAVSRGASFIEAFKLANFDRLQQRSSAETARRAEQAARNKARSKDHLQTLRTSGSGAVPVPADVKEMYHYLMPGKSDAEILEHYNRSIRDQNRK